MTPIYQKALASGQAEAATRKLPGIQPVGQADWITIDDAYSEQLAQKAKLLDTRRTSILRCLPGAETPASETLEEVLTLLSARQDFTVDQANVTRPDGATVAIDRADPLATLARLIQEDICILQKQGDEHVLTAALLAFPASWTLAEKIGRPLTRIHVPVPEYDDGVAARVQRLFDGVQAGRPIWRANHLRYADASLYHPRSEQDPHREETSDPRCIRSERQTVWRLPRSKAVVFAIHTTITPTA